MTDRSLNLRSAAASDDDALWAMLEPIFRAGETYTVPRDASRADALAYWCADGHRVFVAEEAGAPVGSYFLCPNQPGGGAHVCNCGFVTDGRAQGRGVARRMVDHALGQAKAAGYRAMQFNFVVGSNVRALTIWERYGFNVVGRLPGAFRHPRDGYVDALILFKTL